MGVVLYFTARGPVPEPAEAAIRAELSSSPLLRWQPWLLCEPPWFYAPEAGRPLRGRTKLNVLPASAEAVEFVEREEPDDIEALVTALCDWSERYGVAWTLDIDGRRQGRIERGRCGWCLRRWLRAAAAWLKERQRDAARAAP